MWEQIRANKRKSEVLVFVMAMLLLALGFVLGALLFMPNGEIRTQADMAPVVAGGVLGVAIAGIVWVVMSLVAYFGGGGILMAASGARPIEKQDHPQLFNVVEEMTIAAGLGKMPKIYIIDDNALNAFATGRSPDHCAVAITRGLLARLNRDELQGVIAHEMSHVVNRDVLFMTMIGVMVGSIAILSDVFLRGMWYSGGARRSRYSSDKGGGQAQAILMVVAIVLAIIAPILARIVYLAASRKREYLADANAAVLTRYPMGLASALEVIRQDSTPLAGANSVTAPMYIKNPLSSASVSGWFSTHPPIEDRIRILNGMGGGASFLAYQEAWDKIGGSNAGHLPASALASKENPAAREAHPEAAVRKSPREQAREVGDLVRKVNQFLFIPCACGLRLKLPPDFKREQVTCPRCGNELRVPQASA